MVFPELRGGSAGGEEEEDGRGGGLCLCVCVYVCECLGSLKGLKGRLTTVRLRGSGVFWFLVSKLAESAAWSSAPHHITSPIAQFLMLIQHVANRPLFIATSCCPGEEIIHCGLCDWYIRGGQQRGVPVWSDLIIWVPFDRARIHCVFIFYSRLSWR